MAGVLPGRPPMLNIPRPLAESGALSTSTPSAPSQPGALSASASGRAAGPRTSIAGVAHSIRFANGLLRREGQTERLESSTAILSLKAELGAAKLENEQLLQQLHEGEQSADEAIGDVSHFTDDHEKLRQEVESFKKQVEHQGKEREAHDQRIVELETRLAAVRDRRSDARRAAWTASQALVEVEKEATILRKQAAQRTRIRDELRAEQERLCREATRGEDEQDCASAVVEDSAALPDSIQAAGTNVSAKGSLPQAERKHRGPMDGTDPHVVEMLQAAHTQISSLWDQLHKKRAELREYGNEVSEQRMKAEVAELRDKSGFLKAQLTARGVRVGHDPRTQEFEEHVGKKHWCGHAALEAMSLADEETGLVRGIMGGLWQRSRRLPRCGRRRLTARRRRYGATLSQLKEDLPEEGQLTEKLCKALSGDSGLKRFANMQLARSRAELEGLRRAWVRDRTACSEVVAEAQFAKASLKAAHAKTCDELTTKRAAIQKQEHALVREVEISRGSDQALASIHRFFIDTADWLQGQVQLGERDAEKVEDLHAAGKPMGGAELAQLLQESMHEKQARLKQIHKGCVNVERDIRRGERLRQREEPNLQAIEVRWTGDSDEIDADMQTTGQDFVFGRSLWSGRLSLAEPLFDNPGRLEVDVSASLVSDTDVLVRTTFVDGLRPPLFFYMALNEFLFLEGGGTDGGETQPTEELEDDVAEALGRRISDSLLIEEVRSKWRLRLCDMSSGKDQGLQCVETLDLDCLYNDTGALTCAVMLGNIPFSATVLPCRRTRFGMSFVHVRLYQVFDGWTRWITLSQRDLCRVLGCASLTRLEEVWRQESVMEQLSDFLEEAFAEGISRCSSDDPSWMVEAVGNDTCCACGHDVLVVEGDSLADDEKQKIVSDFLENTGYMIKDTGRRGRRGSVHGESEHSAETIRAAVAELSFFNTNLIIDPDGHVDMQIVFDEKTGAPLLGGEWAPHGKRGSQEGRRKTVKKEKSLGKGKRSSMRGSMRGSITSLPSPPAGDDAPAV